MTLRAAVFAALDALEAGDSSGATDLLLAALEDGPRPARRHACELCGFAFEWPGLLDHHCRFAHAGCEREAS